MTIFRPAISIASLAARAPASPVPTVAFAALRVTWRRRVPSFSVHTILARSPAALGAWTCRLTADDPLPVGYRLLRTSRRLMVCGVRHGMADLFRRVGRGEVGTRKLPLSALAAGWGLGAVDEGVLHWTAEPVSPATLADLALVNAIASWVIWVCELTRTPECMPDRRVALKGLVDSLVTGREPDLFSAALLAVPQ